MEWLSIGLLSISILLGLLALVASGYVAMSLLKGKSGERDKAKRVYLLRSLPFLIAPARFFWSSFPHLKFAFSLFSFFTFQFFYFSAFLHFSLGIAAALAPDNNTLVLASTIVLSIFSIFALTFFQSKMFQSLLKHQWRGSDSSESSGYSVIL